MPNGDTDWRLIGYADGLRTMKASEIRDLTDDQLDDELLKLKKEQFNLRFQKASGQLENTVRVRQVRRDIARILTIQDERRRSASTAS